MHMSKIILNSLVRKGKGVITFAVQDIIVEIIYSYYCELRIGVVWFGVGEQYS
jgi:hypothetical protein